MVAVTSIGVLAGFLLSKNYPRLEQLQLPQPSATRSNLYFKERVLVSPDDSACVDSSAPSSEPLLALDNKQTSRAVFLLSLVSVPFSANSADDSLRMSQPTSNKSAAQDESLSGFVAGAALSAIKTLVKYPLDTATVRLQTTTTGNTRSSLETLFRDCYAGVTVPLVTNIPAGAVFFAVKDATKAALTGGGGGMNKVLSTCIAVAVAQLPYWVVRNPSEVIKTRQQAGVSGYDGGPWSAIQQVLRKDTTLKEVENGRWNSTAIMDDKDAPLASVGAFYTGYWENILYAYPADVVKFLCYDQLTKRKDKKSIRPIDGALAGALATAIAQCITTPLDVVRNRVMTTPANDTGTSVLSSYGTALVQLAQREGLAGLFAGVTPRIGKAVLSGAIQFATYEETKQEVAKLLVLRREGK